MMNTSKTDAAIEQIRKAALPACPGSLEDNVWRKIRQRRTEGAVVPWFVWIDALLAEKRFITATVALAFVVSVSTALLLRPVPHDSQPQVSTSIRLDFDSITHAPVFPFDHP